MVAVLSWLTAQVPGQGPPPPGERGPQDPGRPPRDDDGPGEPPPPPPPPSPFGPPPNRLFMAIDTDDDGELSAREIASAPESIARLDRNKDGIITEDEVRPPPPPPTGGRRGPGGPPDAKALVDSVMRFDKDGDGKVTARELPDRMARMLEQGDANHDRSLDRSEIETLASRQSPRRPGRSGGGPPRGGPPGGGPPGGPEDR
jgi:EF hand